MIIEVSQLPIKTNWNNSVVDTKAHNAGKKENRGAAERSGSEMYEF